MSLDTMKQRLTYHGGNQDGRMNEDKLRGLRKALLYSYQDATMVLADGREFRCLINPDKNSYDYDDKILSVPYDDICLNKPPVTGKTKADREIIGIKPGDVFLWKETNTHWLVYLENIEEDAYFRAAIRRCDQQVEVDDEKYWVYLRGPAETTIQWNQKAGIEWNDMNYSLVMFISKDDKTRDHFHRFTKIKVEDEDGTKKTWQVATVNPYYADGIIKVCLNEYFENPIAEAAEAEKRAKQPPEEVIPPEVPYITGPQEISAYSTVTYEVHNTVGGIWYFEEDGKTYPIFGEDKPNPTKITVDINKKKGNMLILYIVGDMRYSLPVTVKAF